MNERHGLRGQEAQNQAEWGFPGSQGAARVAQRGEVAGSAARGAATKGSTLGHVA